MATTNSGTTASETFGTTSAVTGSAPTASTDGQPLADLDAVTVVAVCPSAQTFSGAGTLQCYLYDGSVALWARCASLDLTVPSGSRAVAFSAMEVVGGRNSRVKWVPSGVTFSGGNTGVVVYQLGHCKQFKGRYA